MSRVAQSCPELPRVAIIQTEKNGLRTDRRTDRPTDGPTAGRTDRPRDTPSYRDARTHLKNSLIDLKLEPFSQNLLKFYNHYCYKIGQTAEFPIKLCFFLITNLGGAVSLEKKPPKTVSLNYFYKKIYIFC